MCSTLFAVFCLLFIGVYSDDPSVEKEMTVFRLPNDTEPTGYSIKLIPLINVTLNNDNKIPPPSYFQGEVNVTITVKNEGGTSTIVLHARDLNISSVTVNKKRNSASPIPIPVAGYNVSTEDQLLYIHTGRALTQNDEYVVNIKYNGTHNNDMQGFYQSVYLLDTKMKILAATQFESTAARQAFPCYDEPKYRTPFNISIAREKDQVALSNVPVKETIEDASINRMWDVFETTEPMATYLVAFAVSSFEFVEAKFSADWHFRVYARENAIDQAEYITEEGPKLLAKLEELTGIHYKLPKMDIVTIPDFAAGAMENWGMTTYRESRALTSNLSTTRQRMIVTQVVAHEFAHQWFGDLVTPIWWTYVWLNEAFATYYEYLIPALVEPDWRMRDFFVIEELQTALAADGYMVHRPMSYYVNTPKEISDQFDVIIYNKGGAVLRMLQHVVSKATFNDAITQYLEDNGRKRGSVTPLNLWDAFEDQVAISGGLPGLSSDTPITDTMTTWTEQPGYPLITITRDYVNGSANSVVKITQEVYRNARSTKKLDNYIWYVPISCTSKSNQTFEDTKPQVWLTTDTKNVTLSVKSDEWLICNLQQTGYYRVNYDQKNWDMITEQLINDHTAIDILNRAQIINDVFNLAMDDIIDFHIPFKLANYLHNETDIIPWLAAINVFYNLRDIYQDTDVQHLLEVRFSTLLTEQYSRLTLKVEAQDDDVKKVSRQLLSTAACSFNLPGCISEAQTVMDNFIETNGKMSVSPDILPAAFCVGIRYEKKAEADDVVYQYYLNNLNDASILEIVFPALACSQNETRLEGFLELQFKNELPFRKQDHRYMLLAIQKYRGANAAFTLINKRLPDIKTAEKSVLGVLENMMSALGKYGCTDGHLDAINKIIASDSFKDAPKSFKESATKAQENIASRNSWRKKHQESLIAELSETPGPEPEPTKPPSPEEPTSTPPSHGSSVSISKLSAIFLTIVSILSLLL